MLDFGEIGRRAARLSLSISRLGLELELGEDFGEFRRLNATLPRGELTPVMDPQCCDLGPHNGFWLRGRTADGELAHIQAARYVGLVEGSLASHFDDWRELYCSPGLGIEVWRSDVAAAAASLRLRGRFCYHGEMWLDPKLRGRGLSPLLIRFAMAEVMARWAPDYLFGLTLPVVTNAKFVRRIGYAHWDACGIRWLDAEGETVREEGLVWSSGAELLAELRAFTTRSDPRRMERALQA